MASPTPETYEMQLRREIEEHLRSTDLGLTVTNFPLMIREAERNVMAAIDAEFPDKSKTA